MVLIYMVLEFCKQTQLLLTNSGCDLYTYCANSAVCVHPARFLENSSLILSTPVLVTSFF